MYFTVSYGIYMWLNTQLLYLKYLITLLIYPAVDNILNMIFAQFHNWVKDSEGLQSRRLQLFFFFLPFTIPVKIFRYLGSESSAIYWTVRLIKTFLSVSYRLMCYC
ncbi:hypothetical protein BC829DRAFT_271385 [Chytridium lagenaria]|nr:hypothetical protein BC829DRAFT_271385 [Chytridium lagenaria]